MSRRLNRSVVTGGVVYPAGTTATADLEAAIANPEFWDGEPETTTQAAPKSTDYSTWSKPDLVAEVQRRELTIDGKGNKPELVSALEDDDKN